MGEPETSTAAGTTATPPKADTAAAGATAAPPATPESSPSRTASLLKRLGRWLERDHLPDLGDLRSLYEASPTDHAASKLARQWADRYQAADADERRSLLAGLVRAGAECAPAHELNSRLFRRLYAQSDRLGLMVELRADMLRWRNQVAGLAVLEQELAGLLSNWFDVGMLELRHINWDSPASLLEKLIQYEAVHEIRSWDDMRRRVAADRRCYAFFHPRMTEVPLIFVEVAFAEQMAANVQALIDPARPVDDIGKARWAIFYSISNTQRGLRGISFGNFLLRRVIEELLTELPRLKFFATLSPIPGFAEWLGKCGGADIQDCMADKAARQALAQDPRAGAQWVERLRAAATAQADEPDEVGKTGLRLAAHYLRQMRGGQPLDPVARFHLGNGARIERLNWAADRSAKGLEQSCGLMVNYQYELDQLDENRARLAAGKPRLSRGVQWL
ncbi:malonyl-CoA decarboxylase domain-containing protein [Castellaniella caeni]|uniref:malonyl-CoA decarboxylase domain-containing protein n=1 Tax=Castellaniella caeni TaxID=266123 RepID=UPI0035711202